MAMSPSRLEADQLAIHIEEVSRWFGILHQTQINLAVDQGIWTWHLRIYNSSTPGITQSIPNSIQSNKLSLEIKLKFKEGMVGMGFAFPIFGGSKKRPDSWSLWLSTA